MSCLSPLAFNLAIVMTLLAAASSTASPSQDQSLTRSTFESSRLRRTLDSAETLGRGGRSSDRNIRQMGFQCGFWAEVVGRFDVDKQVGAVARPLPLSLRLGAMASAAPVACYKPSVHHILINGRCGHLIPLRIALFRRDRGPLQWPLGRKFYGRPRAFHASSKELSVHQVHDSLLRCMHLGYVTAHTAEESTSGIIQYILLPT